MFTVPEDCFLFIRFFLKRNVLFFTFKRLGHKRSITRASRTFYAMIRAVGMMKFWKKTLPFILLNVLVSAATLLAVLYFWQQKNPLPKAEFTSPIITPMHVGQTSSPSSPTAQVAEDLLHIEGVFGAGDIQVEYILLRNPGESPVDLSGWRIISDGGKNYRFPNLTLYPKGAVNIYTGPGTDTVTELHWNSDAALWASGDHLTLFDSQGNEHTQFTVP